MSSTHEGGGPPPGWYNDPHGTAQRWWDGERWTEHVSSEAYVLHPPSAYVPEHPVLERPGSPPALTRSRPSPPPAMFWSLPLVVVSMIAGAAGTWVSVGVDGREFATLGGLQNSGDGWLVVLSALVASVLMAVWVFERAVMLPAVAAVVGSVAALVSLYRALNPDTGVAVTRVVDVAPGWGVWVALIASVALVGVSIVLGATARSQARSAGDRGG